MIHGAFPPRLASDNPVLMKQMFSAYLKRVDRDDEVLPPRLYALLPAYPLAALVDRVDAGEDRETLAGDYGPEFGQIEDAVFYERAA